VVALAPDVGKAELDIHEFITPLFSKNHSSAHLTGTLKVMASGTPWRLPGT